MSADRLHEIWTKYLAEGALLPEEEQELARAFRENPAAAEQLLGDVEIDGLLRGLPESAEDADASARRFLDAVHAEKDEERFVGDVFTKLKAEEPRIAPRAPRQVTRRATPRKATLPAPLPWKDLAVAAGVLIAIALAYALLRPSPTAPPKRAPEIVRPPEPREMPEPHILRLPEAEPKPVEPPLPPPITPAPTEPKEPAPAPPPPKPAPESAPVKPPETVEPSAPRTVIAVATIDKVEGDVLLGGAAAKAGDGIPAGGSVETTTAASSASVRFADGTRLDLGADTQVLDVSERQAGRGRRVTVSRGSVAAVVTKQPADQPMTFATPHGEARILGTSLRIEVGKATRLEVKEGRVRFTRNDGKKVDVAPGQYVVTGTGGELAARPLASERRVLYQWDFDGPNAAAEWDRGTIDRTQTFGGSRGALKAMFKPDADYAVHAEQAYVGKPLVLNITEKTTLTFAYYIGAPVEMKVQLRVDRSKATKYNIGYIIESPKAGAWTTVTVRWTEAFRARAGIGDPVKPGPVELDNLQFHAGPDGKSVEFFIDNLAILE